MNCFVKEVSKNRVKCLRQFAKAQGDVHKLLVLSNQQVKTPKHFIYDKENQQIFTFDKLEPNIYLAFFYFKL